MPKLAAVLVVLSLLLSPSSNAQTPSSEEQLSKAIENLNQSQKAILNELQEIRKLLAQQGRPPVDALPSAVNISNEPFQGPANAKVALIEFSEFQCPFCSRHDKETFPQIEKEYIQTGKIKYVWRDLPLDFHKNAFKAAEAAHCAGEQGKFWQMHDRLFDNQKNLAAEDLPRHAEALQLNASSFQQCLDSDRYAKDIKKDIAEANNAGITGTPTFLIGLVQPNGTVKVTRKLVGAKPYAEFKAAIDSTISQAPAGSQ